MKLADARKLRDEIRARGLHCVVPLGYGPNSYFARIFNDKGPVEFTESKQWLEYQRQKVVRQLKSKPRTPFEIMFDKACGIE